MLWYHIWYHAAQGSRWRVSDSDDNLNIKLKFKLPWPLAGRRAAPAAADAALASLAWPWQPEWRGPTGTVTVTVSVGHPGQRTDMHLEPWHPDIECRTHDIEQNIRYRSLRYRNHIDIEKFHNRYRMSISYVYDIEGHISRYRRSRKDKSISNFRFFDIDQNNVDIVLWYRIRYRKFCHARYRRSISGSISYTI